MRNEEIFDEVKEYMPGGVNSPVRAYRGYGNKSSCNEVLEKV